MRKCDTTRKGFRCQFATRDGKCTYNDGTCSPIVSACNGCTNIETYNDIVFCKSYMCPESKWVGGAYCPMCSIRKVVENAKAQKINPLKASKRAAKARKASISSSPAQKSKK